MKKKLVAERASTTEHLNRYSIFVRSLYQVFRNLPSVCIDNTSCMLFLVQGLCKLGSFGGGDVSSKSFAEGSTQTLAKACRK